MEDNHAYYTGFGIGIIAGIIAKIIELSFLFEPNNALAIVLTPFLIYYLAIIFRYKKDYDKLKFYRNNIVLNGIMWTIATYILLINTSF